MILDQRFGGIEEANHADMGLGVGWEWSILSRNNGGREGTKAAVCLACSRNCGHKLYALVTFKAG